MLKYSNNSEDFFTFVEELTNGSMHCRYDPKTGLKALIAIDSTQRGPALGGCRFLHYDNILDAANDVLRLAKGMTYKAAISNLAFGGGKSVILKPKEIRDRKEFFHSFAEFVNDLGGKYITAVDSGSSIEDMDFVSEKTPYVSGVSNIADFPTGDPSYFTAIGVTYGIKAAAKHKFNKESLQGLHIAIQGLGHVGYILAEFLIQEGAIITGCDPNLENLNKAKKELEISVCTPEDIYSLECDIFAPCALGGILNQTTISKLKTSIVAGSANNQLAKDKDGILLHEKGILYAPDYAINAAGLIYATEQYLRSNEEAAKVKAATIFDTMMTIFERSAKQKKSTHIIADELARERLCD